MEEGKKIILAVDDMPLTLAAIRTILQNDFDIRLTKSPKTAFVILNTIQVDLILLDIEMPEMSGFEFLKELRTNPDYAKHKTTPVIFVTSHETEEFVQQVRASGAEGYVSKPIIAQALIDKIGSAIEAAGGKSP
jgi:CheY-like chemotaxis protein